MICVVCEQEINATNLCGYEVQLCDGRFMHTKRKPDWSKFCDKINYMTYDVFDGFIDWTRGENER